MGKEGERRETRTEQVQKIDYGIRGKGESGDTSEEHSKQSMQEMIVVASAKIVATKGVTRGRL